MKPAPFVHHAPRTVAEATGVLAEVGHDGKVLAGGQSLVPMLNMRLATPAHLVDVNGVAGLDEVGVAADHVRVGALVRHADLERHDEAYAALPLLRQALRHVAHPVIRNRGTTVGSVAHADAAGEMPSVLALCDGVLEAVSDAGAREIAWHDFFLGPLETSLAPEELVVAVRFGRLPTGTGTSFVERARRHGDYALAGAGAAVTVDDGVVAQARLTFVSVTDVPVVLDVTEPFAGREPASVDWAGAAQLVADGVEPEADIHATAEYRRMLVVELSRIALAEAASRSAATQGDPTDDAPPSERDATAAQPRAPLSGGAA